MANPQLNSISLCAGVGAFDLGFSLGCEHIGLNARTVAYVEREAFAASQLLALMEAGCLDAAPICPDLAEFDGRTFRGVVDCIIAGLPCQPYSVAGKRKGHTDQRSYGDDDSGPLGQAIRIISEVQPTLAFFENVPPWVMGGHFRRFGEELCDLGYDILEPLFLAAEDVGASHRRERVFILAIRQGRGLGVLRESFGGGGFVEGDGEELADAADIGREQRTQAGRNALAQPEYLGFKLANPSRERRKGRELRSPLHADRGGQEAHGSTEQLCGIFAPGPSDPRWAKIIARFPYIAPATKPNVRCEIDGMALLVDESRRHQLRAIGNGVVPLCAALAFIELKERLK